jgi:hypothetical protein
VGEFRFGEIAETVIQREFNGCVGPKTIGFSGVQFHFVVDPRQHRRKAPLLRETR